MISREELKEKTGYDSFLKFRRSCYSSAVAFRDSRLTTYYFDKTKEVDLRIEPQELFTLAEQERKKRTQH
jgi:hypothetical protein